MQGGQAANYFPGGITGSYSQTGIMQGGGAANYFSGGITGSYSQTDFIQRGKKLGSAFLCHQNSLIKGTR